MTSRLILSLTCSEIVLWLRRYVAAWNQALQMLWFLHVFNTDIEIQFYCCFYESVRKILEYAVDKGVEYI